MERNTTLIPVFQLSSYAHVLCVRGLKLSRLFMPYHHRLPKPSCRKGTSWIFQELVTSYLLILSSPRMTLTGILLSFVIIYTNYMCNVIQFGCAWKNLLTYCVSLELNYPTLQKKEPFIGQSYSRETEHYNKEQAFGQYEQSLEQSQKSLLCVCMCVCVHARVCVYVFISEIEKERDYLSAVIHNE